MMLAAYAGIQVNRLDPRRAPALLMNFIGSVFVILSMTVAFNLAACVMEGAWALLALYGLVKLLLRRP